MLAKLARYLLRNNENFKKLDAMLSKPDDWRSDFFCLYYKKGELIFWIHHGISNFHIDRPTTIHLGFLMRHALWSKAKELCKKDDKLTALLKSIEAKETK